jgi:hypothetical protein
MIIIISIYHLYTYLWTGLFVTNVGTNTKANIIRRNTPNNMCSKKTSKRSTVINATFLNKIETYIT